jgi:hypothetical protein
MIPGSRWRAAAWPAACLESERLFGQPHARLFPLLSRPDLDRRVDTPGGPGRLLSVFAEEVQVALAGKAGVVAFLKPWDVVPLN